MGKIMLRIYFSLYLFFFVIIPLYPIYTSGFTAKSFLLSITIMAIYLLLMDLIFKLAYRLFYRRPYQMIPKVPFSKLYVEPHPYMPFVYKARAITQNRQIALYPLHHGKYWFPRTQSNNYRYFNGPGGDRDIVTPKPPGLIRINCLGASTTGNDLEYNGVIYSYPLELERILHKKFPGINL